MRAPSLSQIDLLLRDLIPTTDELRRLAVVIHPELADVLPGEIASPERLREVLLTQVECRGLVDDLLATLRIVRPRMIERIDEIDPPRRRGPSILARSRSPEEPALRAPRIVDLVPPNNGELSLLGPLVELLATAPDADERHALYLHRLADTRPFGFGPRPHLLLHGEPSSLSLRAYPALVTDADGCENAHELALSGDHALVALYCPFGYHQAGPKFRLTARPPTRGCGSVIAVDLLGETVAPLEIRIRDVDLNPADPLLTEGSP